MQIYSKYAVPRPPGPEATPAPSLPRPSAMSRHSRGREPIGPAPDARLSADGWHTLLPWRDDWPGGAQIFGFFFHIASRILSPIEYSA